MRKYISNGKILGSLQHISQSLPKSSLQSTYVSSATEIRSGAGRDQGGSITNNPKVFARIAWNMNFVMLEVAKLGSPSLG